MKRQKVRKGLILISFVLFPLIMWYFSPDLIIEGAAQGIIVGSFIVFVLQFGSALLFGRGFCGWLCPAAGLQEAYFLARDKKAKGGKLNWIKYFFWVPWIGIILLSAIRAGGFRAIDPFFRTTYGISIAEPVNYVVFYGFLSLVTLLSLTAGRRAFCHYVCWMAPFMVIGRKIRNIFKWPALYLKSNKEKCVDCRTCTQNCPMSLDVNGMVQKSTMETSECILCGTCIDGCPEGVIEYTFGSGNK